MSITKNDDIRWKYLASIVTFILFVSLCVIIIGAGFGFIILGVIPQSWFLLYATVISTATIWLYGAECYDVFTKNT